MLVQVCLYLYMYMFLFLLLRMYMHLLMCSLLVISWFRVECLTHTYVASLQAAKDVGGSSAACGGSIGYVD